MVWDIFRKQTLQELITASQNKDKKNFNDKEKVIAALQEAYTDCYPKINFLEVFSEEELSKKVGNDHTIQMSRTVDSFYKESLRLRIWFGSKIAFEGTYEHRNKNVIYASINEALTPIAVALYTLHKGTIYDPKNTQISEKVREELKNAPYEQEISTHIFQPANKPGLIIVNSCINPGQSSKKNVRSISPLSFFISPDAFKHIIGLTFCTGRDFYELFIKQKNEEIASIGQLQRNLIENYIKAEKKFKEMTEKNVKNFTEAYNLMHR